MSIKFETLSDEDKSARLLDYAKGRLSDQACAEIDAVAAEASEIAEELEYYKGLTRAVSMETDTSASPGELGWARLSREIEASKSEGAGASVPVAANDNGRWWRYAAMALGLVVSGQFAMQFLPAGQDDEARYVPVTAQSDDTLAQVTFVPLASEEAIRGLLLSTDATIVSGPSALGVYELGFADETARDDGLATLNETPQIVEAATAR